MTIEHGAPGCKCDSGGEHPECRHHGYEAMIRRLQDEVDRLREAIHAHRVARRYNPRAPWVDARLWDATGEEI